MTHICDECVSFVYTPKKPSCLGADGTCDYEKYQALLAAAKQGDSDAQVKIFEQHQGIWKRIIREYKDKFETTFVDGEDLMQEAFYALMMALKQYDNIRYTKSFSEYYANVFIHHLVDIIKVQSKEVTLNCFICSLDTRDEEGNLIYDIPVDPENDYFSDYYPQVKTLLTEMEFKIVILHYVEGVSLKVISKQFGVSYRTIKSSIKAVKDKLIITDK